jgi:hypothetical protein
MKPVVAVGRYEIVRPIGEGGMAQVYLCLRRGAGGFQKRVVIKVLHSNFVGRPDHVQMFLDEARVLARLRHPNIVDVFEVECIEGIPYLAMEYVNGPTLGKLHNRAVRANLDHLGYLMHVLVQVCHGLHYAHALRIDGEPGGIVHRDVSSQNIVIEAETGVAKLIDFGIARFEDGGRAKTEVGVFKGKIHYMAPETLHGAKADPRVDIYAVGVLLYRLVTNRMPFAEGEAIWAARMSGRYPKASEVVPGVSPHVEAIIDRERYQTAAQLAADLQIEVERLGIDATRTAEWIRTVFPGGEEEWWKRPTNSTMHTSLSHLVSDHGLKPIRSPRQLRRIAVVSGLAAVVTAAGIAAMGAAVGVSLTGGTIQEATAAAAYLDAADELIAGSRYEAARTLNAKADALGETDTATIARILRQKHDILRDGPLSQARSQIQAGRLEDAMATVSDALEVTPSSVQLQEMFDQLAVREE